MQKHKQKQTKPWPKLHIPSQELDCQIHFALQFRTPVPTNGKTRPAPNRYTAPALQFHAKQKSALQFQPNGESGTPVPRKEKSALQFQLKEESGTPVPR